MAQKYARATDHIKGIGSNLAEIANQDVLLVRASFDERNFGGDDRAIVYMTIAVNPDKPEETAEYHAWSDSLAQKLAEIPSDAFPVIVRFVKVRTRSNFEVWSVE